jgi:hypothetical protein
MAKLTLKRLERDLKETVSSSLPVISVKKDHGHRYFVKLFGRPKVKRYKKIKSKYGTFDVPTKYNQVILTESGDLVATDDERSDVYVLVGNYRELNRLFRNVRKGQQSLKKLL